MLAFAAAFAIGTQQAIPAVEEYFPSTVGTTWVYQDGDRADSTYTDKVIEPVLVKAKPSITIETRRGQKILGTSHYRIEDNTVFAVAFNTGLEVMDPHPVLKLGPKALKWEYKGSTPRHDGNDPMQFKAISTPVAPRELFGKFRNCFRVEIETRFKEAGGLLDLQVSQVSIHANGIGMIELKETSTFQKQSSTRKVTLIRFEQPQ